MNDEFDTLEDKIAAARAVKGERARAKVEDRSDDGRAGIHAGIEFVASIFIPALIGWKVDEWLGTSPGFFLGFMFLGIFGGFYSVYKISQGLGSAVGHSPLPETKKDVKTASNSIKD